MYSNNIVFKFVEHYLLYLESKMSSSNGFWNLVFFAILVIAINSLKGALLNFLDDAPIVSTRLGKIRGRYGRMSSGDACYMFRGIRYAQSPVNELRFMVYNIPIL